MNFGQAIASLKSGNKVCRYGWNGKNMFLFYVPDWSFPKDAELDLPSLPFIAMKTADNKIVPWLASQTDVLAEDWEMVN